MKAIVTFAFGLCVAQFSEISALAQPDGLEADYAWMLDVESVTDMRLIGQKKLSGACEKILASKTPSKRLQEKAYFIRARAAYEANRSAEAKEAIERALSLAPQNPAYRYLSVCIFASANPDAETETTKMIEALAARFPDYAPAQHMRIANIALIGRFNEAFAEAEKAIKKDPNEAVLYVVRGQILIMQGEFRKALADMNAALERATALLTSKLVIPGEEKSCGS